MLRYEAVLEPAAAGAQQAQRLVAVDRERRFVISFYMADQTLSVYEPVLPNSGLQGGKFLERARVYKNGSKLVRGGGAGRGAWRGGLWAAAGWGVVGAKQIGSTAGRPALPACLPTAHCLNATRFGCLQAWYTEEDVKLGVVLELHGRRFRLVRADAFTEQYLASNGGSA